MLNEIYQNLDPVAFSVFGFSVRWYGLAYLAGFIVAGLLIWKIAKRWKIEFSIDDCMTFVLCVIVGLLLGGRLGYCLFYGDGYYLENPLEIFLVNKGGMSFHGALIGALLAGILASKLTSVDYLTLADLACISCTPGIFFGRIANFVNGELWGAQTDLPIGVVFGGSAGQIARHPSQLYEAALEGLVIFIVLFALSYKKPRLKSGSYTALFLMLYGVFRIAVEFVREPDVQIGYLYGGWLTMGMVLSVPVIIFGILLLIYAFKRSQKNV